MKEINLKDIIQKEQLGLRRLCGGLSSRRRQIIVIQCITANIAQIMTSRFTGKIWLKKATHLAVACSIMPTRHKNSLLRKQKELNLEKTNSNSCWEKDCQMDSDGTEDLIELHYCYRQTWVQLFWIQKISVSICWKFAYEQSLKPNDL